MTPSPAIDVVTDGPAAGAIAHKRHHQVDKSGNTSGTSPRPHCRPDDTDPDPRWRQYSAGRALQLGAVLCTEQACFGGAA